MKKYYFIFFVLVAFTLFPITNSTQNITLYNVGTGGPHTSMARGFDTFYNNPALFSLYEKEFSIMKFSLNLKGDALKITNLVLADELTADDPSAVMETLESEELTPLLIGIDMQGPISVGGIGNNWGWNIQNITSTYIDLPYLLGELNLIVREDFVFAVGGAYPIMLYPSDTFFLAVTPGAMGRLTLRNEIEVATDLVGALSMAEKPREVIDDYPASFSPIFGIDLGFNLNVNDWFTFSGVVKDLYSPMLKYPVKDAEDIVEALGSREETTGELVPRVINLGFGYDVPLGALEIFVNDVDVYIDYFDLLYFDKNPFLHIGTGVDITLLNKLHLLAGINEGLLSLGLNIDLKWMDIGFSMYGSEESTEPGLRSVINYMFSFSVSL